MLVQYIIRRASPIENRLVTRMKGHVTGAVEATREGDVFTMV
jgi:hypothetical protein